MSKVLVIGCGGVASVAISKCCQVSDVFTELCIASRTKSKCDALAAKLAPNTKTKITTAQVDADDVVFYNEIPDLGGHFVRLLGGQHLIAHGDIRRLLLNPGRVQI